MDNEKKFSIWELLKTDPQIFGLQMENDNDRRTIYSVKDQKSFLSQARELNIDIASLERISEYFSEFPDALIQFFVVKQPPEGEVNRLGSHYHTDVKVGGSGNEVFVFTEVPPETNIKLEQYHLGKASGEIRYDVKSGAVFRNRPDDFHVFTADGAFKMVQILEGGFKPEDLKKFDVERWTKGDENVIKGRGVRE